MRVYSSNIRTASYDRQKRELEMTFINRPRWVYLYYNVSNKIWAEFIRSNSKGQYFSQIIKDKFQYSRTIK